MAIEGKRKYTRANKRIGNARQIIHAYSPTINLPAAGRVKQDLLHLVWEWVRLPPLLRPRPLPAMPTLFWPPYYLYPCLPWWVWCHTALVLAEQPLRQPGTQNVGAWARQNPNLEINRAIWTLFVQKSHQENLSSFSAHGRIPSILDCIIWSSGK